MDSATLSTLAEQLAPLVLQKIKGKGKKEVSELTTVNDYENVKSLPAWYWNKQTGEKKAVNISMADFQQHVQEEAIKELNDKRTLGKIFCKGILEYSQTPSEDGYYLQKDIDGDLVCLAKFTSGVAEYIDAPIGKLFVVDDNLYVRDAFKIVPVGYTNTVIVAATPMDNVDDIDYTITGNNLDSPSKKIELTSIK